jgi:hypothetical protein
MISTRCVTCSRYEMSLCTLMRLLRTNKLCRATTAVMD